MSVLLTAGSTERADYGDLSLIAGATALSIAITIYTTDSTTTGERIFNQWGASNPDRIVLCQVINNDELGFMFTNGTAPPNWCGRQTTSLNLANSTLYRICVTWTGATVRIYVNGSEVAHSAWLYSTSLASLGDSSIGFDVGYDSNSGNNCVDGNYSELAIYTRELSAAEAISITNGISPGLYPRGLKLYDRMINKSTKDLFGGVAPSYSGGANAPHPRVYYPIGQGPTFTKLGVYVPPPPPPVYCEYLAIMADADVAVQGAISEANVDVQSNVADELEIVSIMADSDVVVRSTISDSNVDLKSYIEC